MKIKLIKFFLFLTLLLLLLSSPYVGFILGIILSYVSIIILIGLFLIDIIVNIIDNVKSFFKN